MEQRREKEVWLKEVEKVGISLPSASVQSLKGCRESKNLQDVDGSLFEGSEEENRW